MKKKLILSLSVLFIALFGLYYWQAEHRNGPPIKNIHLVAFDVKGISNKEEYKALSLNVGKINGVTSCSINEQSKIAAITFYPDLLSDSELPALISSLGNCSVQLHTYEKINGCPVNVWRSWAHQLFSL